MNSMKRFENKQTITRRKLNKLDNKTPIDFL